MKHDYVAEIGLIVALGMMIRGLLILLAEILKMRRKDSA